MKAMSGNIDPNEIAHFDHHAVDWWDRNGPLKALHDINPLRLQYVEKRAGIVNKSILDVGCGGGLLSEALALAGGKVTAIDMTASALQVAQAHMQTSHVDIAYRCMTAEALAKQAPNRYELITCMELLEHVPRPYSVISACQQLLKPGGDLFVATVNRTWTAYLLVILAAEYLLNIVRKGTHAYKNLIQPAELQRWAASSGLAVLDLSGFFYNPFTGRSRLTAYTKMNYLMHLRKP